MSDQYVTRKGIEIVKAGTHKSGSGEFSVTTEDLQAMVTASEGGTLPPAVVKLGHINGAVENPEWGDGAPSYGQITNLRLSEDETTLLGDWVNAPKDLADKQASAYPNRSMEATFNMELKDEDGEVAETYPAVLTGLALLGATPPAVKNLAEIHAAFSTSGRKVFASGKPVRVHAALPGDMTREELDTALRNAVRALEEPTGGFTWLMDWDDTHAFYEVDVQNGVATVRRAYTIEDNQVTWTGDPEPVVARHTFEPVTTTDGAGTVPQEAVSASQSSGTDAAEPVATTATEGEPHMWTDQIRAALRSKFGLAESATDEDIEKAVLADATGDTGDAEPTNTKAETPNTEATDSGDEAGTEPAGEPEKVAASSTPGEVRLSQANFDAFVKEHADMKVELSAIQKERQAAFVDTEIDTAKKAGKLHPRDEDQLRVLFSEAPGAAKKYLDGLTGVIPTQELGSNEAIYASGDTQVDEAKRAARHKLLGIDTESEAR